MRFLLTSHGSTGDIYPVIRLGRTLLDAGHDVRFASVNLFKEDIINAGIQFIELPPHWDQDGFSEAMRDLTKSKNSLDLLRIIYAEAKPFLDEIIEILRYELETTDVFVSNYIFGNLCQLARQMEVPCAVTTFAHNVVPSLSRSPISFPRWLNFPYPFKKNLNLFLWKIVDKYICWNINRFLGSTLVQNELGVIDSYLINPADAVLVTVSPKLFQPRILWNKSFHYTGYLRWQSPKNDSCINKIKDFCDGKKVPILTFGSVTFERSRKIMSRFLKSWPNGKKIIIQSGWAQLSIERKNNYVLSVDRISHDQLFHYASVVIHHGGAGTTASVLHAGKPHIIIPHIGDQNFFAKEIKRLGVGVSIRLKRWPEILPRAVRKIERSKRKQNKALKIAKILSVEEGDKNAVKILEDLALSKKE